MSLLAEIRAYIEQQQQPLALPAPVLSRRPEVPLAHPLHRAFDRALRAKGFERHLFGTVPQYRAGSGSPWQPMQDAIITAVRLA